jgi:hypothetical protein
MRIRLTTLGVGLAVGAIAIPQALASSAREASVLPKLIAGSYAGIRPRIVDFSGDAGNIVTNLVWNWTRASATGRGTSNVQGCVPNCAQGTETPVATVITLSQPSHGHFTKFVEVRDGQRLVGHYGRFSWPGEAS